MKKFWNYVNRWWLVIAISFVLQGLAISEAYSQRGYLAYGGEYLIVPLAVIISIGLDRAIDEFKGARNDKRSY